MIARDLAATIDHTLLRPDATRNQIITLCNEAIEFRFATVCVAPVWVSLAANALRDTRPRVAAVIGFPHGNTLSEAKAFESTRVLEQGASELDMVLNIGALKMRDEHRVTEDISMVVNEARKCRGVIVKVILETSCLTDEEKRLACALAERAGADFVKTSTGFGLVVKAASGIEIAGATDHDVTLLRNAVGSRLGVKASGGIRDWQTAIRMLDAGANRLGCSASVSIIQGYQQHLSAHP
jgi:deoxyribose-phosphate aldolase